jgi:Tfp pilus assembly protein PilW
VESDLRARSCRAGFTLAEVMIAATISTFVLAGVLSAFLLIGRTGFAASSYSELEAETRRALEIFGEDARKATDIHWNSERSITLSVATASNAAGLVTYAYDGETGSATYGCFYRVLGDTSSTLPRRVLIHNVAADFSFQRFKLEQSGVSDNRAATDLETKQLQVTLRASRTGTTTVAANQAALSARYILRNKPVAN